MDLNPDKGSGRPGSLLWHTSWINQCESIGELREYLISVTHKDLPLEQLKTIALNVIKEFKESQDGEG